MNAMQKMEEAKKSKRNEKQNTASKFGNVIVVQWQTNVTLFRRDY